MRISCHQLQSEVQQKNVFNATERNATGMRKTYVVHQPYSLYDKIQNGNDVK